jgi:hypothetical protein
MTEKERWDKAKKKLDTSLKLNEVEQAFYCLEEYFENSSQNNDEKKDELVLFMSQYESVTKKWLQIQITLSEHDIVLNRIKEGLLRLCKLSKPPAENVQQVSTSLEPQISPYIPEQFEIKDESIIDYSTSAIDYDWNFNENITFYFQFESGRSETTQIFTALIKDASWEQFIRKEKYLFTEEEPWGVKIPVTVEPDENEPGFIKIEERPLLWIDAIRFEVKGEERDVVAEAIVIKKEKDSQIWIHAIGEVDAKSWFVSALLRWFDEKLKDKDRFTICLNVPNGRGAIIQPITDNEFEISVKQPFEKI